MKKIVLSFVLFASFLCLKAQKKPILITVGDGWAGNTVNTAVFRKNSLVTFQDTQYIAYYNADAQLIIGKRKIGTTKWELKQTAYKGNIKDAHNIISIMVDGDGYLHIAWDHHNNPLHYVRSVSPGSLELTSEMSMTGKNENRLSYPEFYSLPNGDLLFFYRDGGSGSGNMVINKYDLKTKTWKSLHDNLIGGEGERNAYWQAVVDQKGIIHLSWVWRESPDVASNHDMAYAKSEDGGITWKNSKGINYTLPITASSAEYALKIPQKNELINQTSMSCDEDGNPFIATYWRDADASSPQYHLIYNINGAWHSKTLDFRKGAFSLSGAGTKRIPISRPQVLIKGKGEKASILMLFRDEERGNKASVLKINQLKKGDWTIKDLTNFSLGSWEPTFDTELWRERKILNLFIQNTEQKDGEGLTKSLAQKVMVLSWKPKF